MQSHNAWLRGAESGATTSGAREGDVLYCCLPMHNSAAWVAIVYRALVCGLPFGLDPRFSVADFWDRVRFYGATQIFTLGAMHVFLWQQPERPDDADNPVRVASCIPMPEPLLEPFKRRFGIEQIYQGYGQSEVLGLLSRVDDGRRRWSPNTAGVPLPGIDVRLLDDDDREVGVGEVGEICVRPTEPYVLFNGYFNDAEATLRAGRNLWYHTGDLGRRNEEGEYFFFDRKADYIRYKGRSMSSFEVEAAVTAHPAVAECAAYGVTSAELESEAEIKVDVVAQAGRVRAARRARPLRQRQRALLLRAPLHRARRRAAAHPDRPRAEVPACAGAASPRRRGTATPPASWWSDERAVERPRARGGRRARVVGARAGRRRGRDGGGRARAGGGDDRGARRWRAAWPPPRHDGPYSGLHGRELDLSTPAGPLPLSPVIGDCNPSAPDVRLRFEDGRVRGHGPPDPPPRGPAGGRPRRGGGDDRRPVGGGGAVRPRPDLRHPLDDGSVPPSHPPPPGADAGGPVRAGRRRGGARVVHDLRR